MEKLSNSKFNSLSNAQLEVIAGGKDKLYRETSCVCDATDGTFYSEKVYQRSVWDRVVKGMAKYNKVTDEADCDNGCTSTRY